MPKQRKVLRELIYNFFWWKQAIHFKKMNFNWQKCHKRLKKLTGVLKQSNFRQLATESIFASLPMKKSEKQCSIPLHFDTCKKISLLRKKRYLFLKTFFCISKNMGTIENDFMKCPFSQIFDICIFYADFVFCVETNLTMKYFLEKVTTVHICL